MGREKFEIVWFGKNTHTKSVGEVEPLETGVLVIRGFGVCERYQGWGVMDPEGVVLSRHSGQKRRGGCSSLKGVEEEIYRLVRSRQYSLGPQQWCVAG